MNIKEVNPKEALHLAKSGTIFVDVREKLETDTAKYGVTSIIYLPMSELEQTFSASLPADKNTQIVLACRGGGRSMRAAEFLQTKGYKNLLNLAGGIRAWSNQGLPIQGTLESNGAKLSNS